VHIVAFVLSFTASNSQAQESTSPDSEFRDCVACPEMVVIPSGEYGFGSPPNEFGSPYNEGYILDITIARPFALGKYEVSFDEWDQCANDGHCITPEDEGWGRGRRPVVNVSWHEASAFVAWLSAKTGKQYRLPSEQEWEYAAQSGTQRARFFGIAPKEICMHANVYDETANSVHEFGWAYIPCNDGHAETAPVGSFRANEFGVHDMLGNVWEWMHDCLNPNWRFSRAPLDGRAFVEGDCSQRAFRGGSWISNQPYYLRTADRYKFSGARYNDLGFRVARSLD
jgi:formylglycine-generating enzyme required for sulfatase activity